MSARKNEAETKTKTARIRTRKTPTPSSGEGEESSVDADDSIDGDPSWRRGDGSRRVGGGNRRRSGRNRATTIRTRRAEPWHPRPEGDINDPDRMVYRAFATEFDEITRCRGSVRPDELTRLGIDARSAAATSARGDRAAGQPAAAPPAGQADQILGVRSRGGHARCRPASPGSWSTRCHPYPSRWRRTPIFRDTVVTLLIDNSGSMRGRPDRHRRDERRHSGAHAGTVRRQSGDPGLHHAGLEGRHVAREVDPSGQAGAAGTTERSQATSSISRRMRHGVVRAKIWA